MDNVLEMVLRMKDEATATLKEAGNEITKAKDKVAGMSKTFMVAGGIMTGAGVAGVAAMKGWIDAASEAQVEAAKVDGMIDAMAGTMEKAGVSAMELSDAINHTAQASIELAFDDEETAVVFARNIQITNDLTMAKKMLTAQMDLARYKGIDLAASSQAISMAMQGSTKVLKQLGIEVEDNMTKQEILGKIMERVGGQAEQYASTAAGAQERWNIQFSNLKEVLGDRLLPEFTKLLNIINNFIERVYTMNPEILDAGLKLMVLGTAVSLVGGAFLLLLGALPAITAGIGIFSATLLPAVGIAAAVGAAGMLIATNWQQIQPMMQPVFTFLQGVFNQIKKQIDEFVVAILPSLELRWQQISSNVANALVILQSVWDSVFPSMVAMAQGAWDMIAGIVQVGWGIVETVLSVGLALVTGDWNKAWQGMKTGFEDIWNGIVRFLTGTWNIIVNMFKSQINTIIGMLNGFIDIVNKAGGKGNGGGIAKLQSLQSGGYVDMTGAAFLHEGEFVLSRGMLNGDRNIPKQIMNTFSQPINIQVAAYTPVDYDAISTRLAWYMRNSR